MTNQLIAESLTVVRHGKTYTWLNLYNGEKHDSILGERVDFKNLSEIPLNDRLIIPCNHELGTTMLDVICTGVNGSTGLTLHNFYDGYEFCLPAKEFTQVWKAVYIQSESFKTTIHE